MDYLELSSALLWVDANLAMISEGGSGYVINALAAFGRRIQSVRLVIGI